MSSQKAPGGTVAQAAGPSASDIPAELGVFCAMPVVVDPKLPPGRIEVRHPDGRVDRFDLT